MKKLKLHRDSTARMKAKACALKKLENKCFTRCSKSARVFASHRDSRDQILFEFVPKRQHKLLYKKNQLVAISFARFETSPNILECCIDEEEWQLLGHATQTQEMPDTLVSHLFVVLPTFQTVSETQLLNRKQVLNRNSFMCVWENSNLSLWMSILINVDLVQVLNNEINIPAFRGVQL